MQTLIVLDLGSNKICAQGVQHLADALQQNEVMLTLTSYNFFTISHRHSPDLISMIIKSVRKEQSTLPMLYKKNKVTSSLSHSIVQSLFHTDSHHAGLGN
jgi:hypothetical protein